MFNRSDISMAKNQIGPFYESLKLSIMVIFQDFKKKTLKLIFRQLLYLFHLNL